MSENEPLDLGAIKARLAAATPGPWGWLVTQESDEGNIVTKGARAGSWSQVEPPEARICWFGDSEQYYPTSGYAPDEFDLALILNAPTDITALLAELDRVKLIAAGVHLTNQCLELERNDLKAEVKRLREGK